MMLHDLPLWAAVYQQTQRWFNAGVLKTNMSDVCMLLRLMHKREPTPSAAIFCSRTQQSSPEMCDLS
jgi:transposase